MGTERRSDIGCVMCGTGDLLISNAEHRNWERSLDLEMQTLHF